MPKYGLFFKLPIFLKEILAVVFSNFETHLKRYQPLASLELDEECLTYLYVCGFTPVGLSEADMDHIKFPLVAPFEEYEIEITAATTDPNRERIGVRYKFPPNFEQAIINGFMASSNCSGDPESFRDFQHFYTCNLPINEFLLNKLDKTIKSMRLSASLCHIDFQVCPATRPAWESKTISKLLIKNHILTLCPEYELMRRKSQIISKRNSGREIITVPAGSGDVSVNPVPATRAEAETELAQLTSQMTEIQARVAALSVNIQERVDHEDRVQRDRDNPEITDEINGPGTREETG